MVFLCHWASCWLYPNASDFALFAYCGKQRNRSKMVPRDVLKVSIISTVLKGWVISPFSISKLEGPGRLLFIRQGLYPLNDLTGKADLPGTEVPVTLNGKLCQHNVKKDPHTGMLNDLQITVLLNSKTIRKV